MTYNLFCKNTFLLLSYAFVYFYTTEANEMSDQLRPEYSLTMDSCLQKCANHVSDCEDRYIQNKKIVLSFHRFHEIRQKFCCVALIYRDCVDSVVMAQCHRPWSDVVDILITNRKQELSVACDSSAFITANECSQLYPDMTTNSTDTTISPVKEIPIDMPNNKPSEWTTEANIPERNPLDSPYMDNTNHSLDSYPTYHSGDNSIEPKIESYTSDSYDISFGTSVAIGMALYLLLIHL